MPSKKYGPKAAEKVEKAMHEMKVGKLRSGGSGKKVESREQAIAIGLSEAREAGGKVPPAPKAKAKAKKASPRKKAASRKTASRKSTARKSSSTRKASTRRKK